MTEVDLSFRVNRADIGASWEDLFSDRRPGQHEDTAESEEPSRCKCRTSVSARPNATPDHAGFNFFVIGNCERLQPAVRLPDANGRTTLPRPQENVPPDSALPVSPWQK